MPDAKDNNPVCMAAIFILQCKIYWAGRARFRAINEKAAGQPGGLIAIYEMR
jgi:hypothetical protein